MSSGSSRRWIRFLSPFRGTELERQLAGAASGTFVLNLSSNGLLFLTSLVLAHALGAGGFGTYSLALAWAAVLAIPAECGLGTLLVRNVAAYQSRSAWGSMAGLLSWARRRTLLTSASVTGVAALSFWCLRGQLDEGALGVLLLGTILLIPTALLRVARSTMIGLQRVVRGQIPDVVCQPLVFLILVGGCYLLAPDRLGASTAIVLNVVSVLFAFALATWLLRRVIPTELGEVDQERDVVAWSKTAWALTIVSGIYVVNSRTDVLMLGAMTDSDVVGIYSAATRGSEILMLVLMPMHRGLGPMIASLHAKGNREQLQQIVRKSTRLIALLSLPVAAMLVFFGHWFLLLFGAQFTTGHTPLAVLTLAGYLGILIGPVSMLLIMTGHEKSAAAAVGGTVVVNVVLNAILIPLWSGTGAALATAASKVLMSVLMTIWVLRRLQVNPTIFARAEGRRT